MIGVPWKRTRDSPDFIDDYSATFDQVSIARERRRQGLSIKFDVLTLDFPG